MNFKLYMLETAIVIFTNKKLLKKAKELVEIINNETIGNDVKHARVLVKLRLHGSEFATTVLDIVIKIAVLALKTKMEASNGN